MRKVFHFVSAFGASIASYVGVESNADSNEIIIISENKEINENQASDQYNFPIQQALLNNEEENTGFVLIDNNGNQDSEIIQPDENSAIDSESDGISEADLREKEILAAAAAARGKAEKDSIDTELARSILEKLDSAEAAMIKEEGKIYSDLEITGLIIDETRSKIGRDFYDAFYANWNIQTPINKYYSILIEEKPARGSVSQIIVQVNDNEVMRHFVQFRTSEIEDMAKSAVYRVQRYLAKENEVRNRLREESDQMGSGIF